MYFVPNRELRWVVKAVLVLLLEVVVVGTGNGATDCFDVAKWCCRWAGIKGTAPALVFFVTLLLLVVMFLSALIVVLLRGLALRVSRDRSKGLFSVKIAPVLSAVPSVLILVTPGSGVARSFALDFGLDTGFTNPSLLVRLDLTLVVLLSVTLVLAPLLPLLLVGLAERTSGEMDLLLLSVAGKVIPIWRRYVSMVSCNC